MQPTWELSRLSWLHLRSSMDSRCCYRSIVSSYPFFPFYRFHPFYHWWFWNLISVIARDIYGWTFGFTRVDTRKVIGRYIIFLTTKWNSFQDDSLGGGQKILMQNDILRGNYLKREASRKPQRFAENNFFYLYRFRNKIYISNIVYFRYQD